MSPQTVKIIIVLVLLLHGVAHARAAFYLLADALGFQHAPTLPVRTWLIPSLSLKAASFAASIFWLFSTIGFLAAAWFFWSAGAAGETWQQLAIGAAILSTAGSALFSGIWPGAPTKRMSSLDTVISLVVNAAILIALLLFHWPTNYF